MGETAADRLREEIREIHAAVQARHMGIRQADIRLAHIRNGLAPAEYAALANEAIEQDIRIRQRVNVGQSALGGMIAASYDYVTVPAPPQRRPSGQGMTRGYWRGAIGQHPGYRLAVTA